MAEYLVTDTDLTTIADAIREKAGVSDNFTFPAGFAEAIAAIEAGGGGFATGTMTITDRLPVDSNDRGVVITHNLGRVPLNFLWFILDSTSVNTDGYLLGYYKIGFEYITSDKYTHAACQQSSETMHNNMLYKIHNKTPYSYLNANGESIKLTAGGPYRASSCIPAGSTIFWMVW